MNILELNDVSYTYNGYEYVLENLNYCFQEGKVYAICGKIGTGKSTLMSLLSHVLTPSDGTIYYNGKTLDEIDIYHYRNHNAGIIYQKLNLLPKLTAIENLELAMDIANGSYTNRRELALKTLQRVHVDEGIASCPIQTLTKEQQQRVAIARAIAHNPQIILADELIEELEAEAQQEIMNILYSLAYEERKCVILLTPSIKTANFADEVYTLVAS